MLPTVPQTVPLSGTGVVPATLTPATATYATQAVGTTSAAKMFTLTNNQTVALTSIRDLNDRRLWSVGDDLHDEPGREGEMHDQCVVYAGGDGNKNRVISV